VVNAENAGAFFCLDAKADAPELREPVGQGFDFEVFRLDGFGIAFGLCQQCLEHRRHLAFGNGVEV